MEARELDTLEDTMTTMPHWLNLTTKTILTTTVSTAGIASVALAITRTTRWAFMTAMLLGMSAAVTAQGRPTVAPARHTEPAIVKASDDYRKAVLGGDARAVAAMYLDDAIVMPNGAGPVTGRAAIEQFYRELLTGPVKIEAFTFNHIESTFEGNVGYDAGTYAQRCKLPTGQTVNDTGKYLVILKRAQGEWKAAYLIYNSDTPPAAATRGSGQSR